MQLPNDRLNEFLLLFFILAFECVVTKDENIGFDGYIGTWILRIYQIY